MSPVVLLMGDKMAQFRCRYMTERGSVKEETIQSSSKDELVASLRGRGYKVINVEEVRSSVLNMKIGSKHLSKKSITLFCRQMSTLLVSGIPMVKCFDIVASQSKEALFKEIMANLSAEVQSGASLSDAMEKQEGQFPEMLIEMVKVGEITGDFSGIMNKMADQYERDAKTRQKIKGALTYPIVLIIIAIGACVFMLIKIVPSFVDVFNSLGSELPALTAGLLKLSTFITKRWYVLVLIIPIIVVALIRVLKMKSVVYQIDKLKLTMPGIRDPMQKLMSSRFARTLYTLISSGVPIVQALEYTKNNVLNAYANQYIDQVILGISQGRGFADVMEECPIFPQLLTSMISVGESSGNLESMLSKTADYFDEETDSAISQLMTLIEPVMIVLVGLLIGVIVMALYAPMFGAITAMQNSI